MIKLSDKELHSKFAEHRKWITTLGKGGVRLNLDDVDLRERNINGVNLEQAYITGCLFDNMVIRGQSFYLSKLYSSSFKNSNLQEVDFTKADLSYADISHAKLRDVNFNNCDCIETDFSNSQFVNVKFPGWFHKADFRNTVIHNVDVRYASFDEILVQGICLKDVKGIEKVNNISINIGSVGNPKILREQEAVAWLKERVVV